DERPRLGAALVVRGRAARHRRLVPREPLVVGAAPLAGGLGGVRVLVTGGAGQLGRDLAALLGGDAVALSHTDLDITNADMVAAAIGEYGPDAIVNCAAWTDVDGCEGDPARAQLVNADGAGNVARAAGDA